MPKANQIPKSLQECLSKLKISNKQFPQRRRQTVPGCGGGKEKEDDSVTLSDIDKFLFENFRSLYREEYEEGISRKTAFLHESPRLREPPPPENLCGSARFFVECGSASSRITDEPFSSVSSASVTNDSSSETPAAADGALAPEDFIALMTYSPDPYDDFRQSMQEMVEVRMEHNRSVDWKFLEELLFCYLDLNNKKSYRFILRAFVDVIVLLREKSAKSPANAPSLSSGARGGKM